MKHCLMCKSTNVVIFKNNGNRYFCSEQCSKVYNKVQNNRHPRPRGNTNPTNCVECGKVMENRMKKKFCSIECKKLYLKKKMSQEQIKNTIWNNLSETEQARELEDLRLRIMGYRPMPRQTETIMPDRDENMENKNLNHEVIYNG